MNPIPIDRQPSTNAIRELKTCEGCGRLFVRSAGSGITDCLECMKHGPPPEKEGFITRTFHVSGIRTNL